MFVARKYVHILAKGCQNQDLWMDRIVRTMHNLTGYATRHLTRLDVDFWWGFRYICWCENKKDRNYSELKK